MIRMVILSIIIATTVIVAGCDPDQMRRDFVAPRYLQQAEGYIRDLPRDTAAAEHAVDRAMQLMRDNEEVELRAARVYAMARAWEKAIPLFEAQEQLMLRDQIIFGHCLLNTGQEERGAELCLQAIADAQRMRDQRLIGRLEWALYLNDAGYILADADVHIEEAHAAVNQAAEAYPLEGSFVDSLGWALFRMNELTDAAFYLERALRLADRDDPEVLYHLGVVYSRLGRYADAYEVLQRAQELDPEYDPITEELRRLGRILPPPSLAAITDTRLQSRS